MQTMNIALPDSLKTYVQKKVEEQGYSSASEYIRELIRADQKEWAKHILEEEILSGLNSGEAKPMTAEDWQQIRQDIRKRYKKKQGKKS